MLRHMPAIPETEEAEAGGGHIQNQPQQKGNAEKFGETLYLNKIKNMAGDVLQQSSASEFNPWQEKKLIKLRIQNNTLDQYNKE